MRRTAVRFLFPLLALLSLALVASFAHVGGRPAPPAAAPAAQAATPAARYTITDLGAHADRRDGMNATALNDQGQVVGDFDNEHGDGFVNDQGQVVGDLNDAFLWDQGHARGLGVLTPYKPGGCPDSVAYGINDRGQIVGGAGDGLRYFGSNYTPLEVGNLVEVGFLFQNNVMRRIAGSSASFEPRAINAKGQIVGRDFSRGFFLDGDTHLRLGTLSRAPASDFGGNFSIATGINDRGQVVGWSTAPGRAHGELPIHAFLWQRAGKSGRMRDLGTLPGWANSYAGAINDRGEVAGSVTNAPLGAALPPASYCRAVLWRAGKVVSLGTLPHTHQGGAFGINNAGAVVGRSGGRAFLWENGHMRDLNDLIPAKSGWFLEEAQAINNKGQIAGNGTLGGADQNGDHQPHAFLLTPQGDSPR